MVNSKNTNLGIILVCCFLIVFYKSTNGQYFPVYKFTSIEGLPHSDVYRIFQDKKGFLWLGTKCGLSCYDGTAFVNYNINQGIYPSAILSIFESSDQKMIICHYDGHIVTISNGKGSDFTNNIPKSSGLIRAIADGDGILFINTNGILYHIDHKKLWANKPIPVLNYEPVVFSSLIRLQNGAALLGANNGLYIYDNRSLPRPYMRMS